MWTATMKSSNYRLIRFRLLAILSVLILTMTSPEGHVAVEGKGISEKELRPSSEESVDPRRQQHRLRFALVYIELSLWYLPTTETNKLLGMTALDTIETATQHFLVHALDENPKTTVTDLSVRVVSQNDTIDPLSATATILNNSNSDSIAAHILTTRIETTVQYSLEMESPELNGMSERIKALFASRPQEILDLLVLLNNDIFGTVFAIGSDSSKTPVAFAKRTNSNETEPNDDESKWQPLGLYILIGLTGLVSVGIGGILLCVVLRRMSKNRSKRCGPRPKMTMDLPLPSVLIHNTITENTTEDPDSVTRSLKTILQNDPVKDTYGKSRERIKTPSVNRKRQSAKANLSIQCPKNGSTAIPKRTIQAVYSEDKLRSPLELNIQELRTKKDDAEQNLKSYITGYCSRWGTDGDPLQKSGPAERMVRPRTYSSRMKEQQRDIESQIQILKNKRNEIEERIREKYDALLNILPSESREFDDISGNVIREDTACRVGPDVYHARVGVLDNDEISALTYGTVSADGNEDQEMEILTIRGKKDRYIKTRSRNRSETPPGYVLPYYQKGYL